MKKRNVLEDYVGECGKLHSLGGGRGRGYEAKARRKINLDQD